MKYLLFLNHPKGEKIFKMNKTKEKRARKYFSTIKTIETIIFIRGKEYSATVDHEMFHKLANFDCFNCQDNCCGGNPSIFENHTRNFILKNYDEYNIKTKNNDILEEFGLTKDEIITSIKEDEVIVPFEFAEDEISNCSCSYKPNNSCILCSVHSIALEQQLSPKDIIDLKPLICSLWPLEILVEDDDSKVYITLPDDFTNSFTREDFYKIACINFSYSESPIFKRINPEGFDEKDYTPIYDTYKDTLIYGLGEQFYKDLIFSLK